MYLHTPKQGCPAPKSWKNPKFVSRSKYDDKPFKIKIPNSYNIVIGAQLPNEEIAIGDF